MTDDTHQNPSKADVPPIPQVPRTLSEEDVRALDALLAARGTGADTGPTPPGLGERTEKLTELFGLLEQDQPADPPADLTARTMQAIQAQQQRKRFADQVQMLSGGDAGAAAGAGRSLNFEWRQLLTAAAVFLIAASLLIPVMQRQRADAMRAVGAGRLLSVGHGMASYATDNLGQMPRGNIRPGDTWIEVGNNDAARSNSAHLFKLFALGYVGIEDLTCPENDHVDTSRIHPTDKDWYSPAAVSFSYQNQYTSNLLRLHDNPTMAVLADRNPLFEVVDGQIVFNPNTSALAPSRAHRGTGQNVLTADGAAGWRTRPLHGGHGVHAEDNFWTARGVDFYTGTETPAEPGDSFLVP